MNYTELSSFMICPRLADFRLRDGDSKLPEYIKFKKNFIKMAATYGPAKSGSIEAAFKAIDEALSFESQLKLKAIFEKYVEFLTFSEITRTKFSIPVELNGVEDLTSTCFYKGKKHILVFKIAQKIDDARKNVSSDRRSAFWQKVLGLPILEVIISKPTLRMKVEETEEEFEARKAEAKGKIKRKEGESPSDYVLRYKAAIEIKPLIVNYKESFLKETEEQMIAWRDQYLKRSGTIIRCAQNSQWCEYFEECCANTANVAEL